MLGKGYVIDKDSIIIEKETIPMGLVGGERRAM